MFTNDDEARLAFEKSCREREQKMFDERCLTRIGSVINVTKEGSEYYARVEGGSGFGTGRNPSEAVGDLVFTQAKDFGLEIKTKELKYE